MKKLTVILSLTVVSSLICSSVAFAADNSELVSADAKKAIIKTVAETKEVSYEVLNLQGKAEKIKDEIKFDLDSKLDKLNNKIVVPKKQKLKEKLLKNFNKDAEKQVENIKNIDNIVDAVVKYYENTKDNDLVAQDFRLYPHWHYWGVKPYLTSHTHNITYANSWIGIDCYRSSIDGQKSNSETKTISYSLGLTGATEIKEFLNLSASWSYTDEASTTVSAGATCPAWNACWWRPYARYEINNYLGAYRTQYYNINGDLVSESQSKTLTNKIPKDEMTEFASATNKTQNKSAATPSAPSGAPNAWW